MCAVVAAAPFCSDAIGLTKNITGPLQRMPLVSLINLLSVAWFSSARCFPLIRTGCCNLDHHQEAYVSPNLLVFLSLSFSQSHDFWRLDYWEDDLRRRRRFVRNPFGSTHLDVTCKSLQEYGELIFSSWNQGILAQPQFGNWWFQDIFSPY